MVYDPASATIANIIVTGSAFITGFTSFIFVKRSVWLKIKS
jgi:hypothetical protein